jgi:hypothetical protein
MRTSCSRTSSCVLAFAAIGFASLSGCSQRLPSANDSAHPGSKETPAPGSGDSPSPPRPSVPEFTYDPAACPSLASCRSDELLIQFTAPPGVEFRQAGAELIVGFDASTNEHVVYSPDVVNRHELLELRRFDSSYDRVLVNRAEQAPDRKLLACRGTQCELLTPWESSPAFATVPAEVEARWSDGNCVGGRGITCFDTNGAWSWLVTPELLAGRLDRFVLLGEREAVALDDKGALLYVKEGAVTTITTGPTSPVVELTGRFRNAPARWLAFTRDHQTIFGRHHDGRESDPTSWSCGTADLAWSSAQHDLNVIRGDTVLSSRAGEPCKAYKIPISVKGFGTSSGDKGSFFVFDAHDIYAERNLVWIE